MLLLLFWGVLPVFGYGQVGQSTNLPAEDTLRLSLMDATERMLRQNFDIRVAKSRVEETEVNNSWGAAGRWPSITFQTSESNNYSNIENPTNPFGQAEITNIGVESRIDARWEIFNGLQTWVSKARLELLEQQSEGNAQLIIENSLQAVLLAYYRCVLERERLQVLQQSLSLSEDRLAYLQNKRELGTATTFEVLQEEQAVVSDRQLIAQQRLTVDQTYRQLVELMGDPPAQRIIVSDTLQLDTTQLSYPELYERMINSNVDLRNQYINLEILQKDVELAERSVMPSLTMETGANISRNYGEIAGLRDGYGSTFGYYLNFTLSFNLFNGGATRRAIATAQIRRRTEELSLDQLQHTLKHNLADLIARYRLQKELYRVAAEAEEIAQQNLRLSQERFKAGTVNSLDLRIIQVNYLNASLQRLEAVFQLKSVEAELLRLTGGLLVQTRK